jgi:LacI family transcriptional regulator
MRLEDIARRAGVSRSTVSRVINNEPYVDSQTREKVMQVIEQVGFVPNPGARMLVTQRTQVLGIVIIRPTPAIVFEDPHFFPEMLQGVVQVAQARDYATLLWLGYSSEDQSTLSERVLKNRLMDGLVITSTADTPLISHLLATQIPFVMVERPTRFEEQISYVSVDNVLAGRTAVEHLINVGRRRIGIICGPLSGSDGQDRLQGYKDALLMASIPFDPDLVVEGSKVDAVFASSDMMAVGALDALQEGGWRVPEDVAVVGFDDLPIARDTNPPLTTIRQPIQQKGWQATRLLIDLLEGAVEGPKQILLPTQLVIRQSCGAEAF